MAGRERMQGSLDIDTDFPIVGSTSAFWCYGISGRAHLQSRSTVEARGLGWLQVALESNGCEVAAMSLGSLGFSFALL